jgi:transcription initiation factor TFIID subunit TAF12
LPESDDAERESAFPDGDGLYLNAEKKGIKKRRQSCLCLLWCKVPVRELISQPEQQVQAQQQVQQVQQVQQEQQVQAQQQVQQQELPASALRPELQEPSVRSQRKKLSSRGKGKRKVFSWFQCIWVFE